MTKQQERPKITEAILHWLEEHQGSTRREIEAALHFKRQQVDPVLSAQRKQGRMYEEDGKFYVVVESAIPNWAKSGSLFPSSRHKAAAPNLSLPQQKAVSHEVEEAIMALERHLHTYTEAVNFAIAILRGKP